MTMHVSVVIPCFRVRPHILGVLATIGPEVASVFVIDDACPDGTGDLVLAECRDPRVTVVRHAINQGVGGAVMTGYRFALAAGADVIARLDGDGQMDPSLIPRFVAPIAEGRADYAKGNRFFNIEDVKGMAYDSGADRALAVSGSMPRKTLPIPQDSIHSVSPCRPAP